MPETCTAFFHRSRFRDAGFRTAVDRSNSRTVETGGGSSSFFQVVKDKEELGRDYSGGQVARHPERHPFLRSSEPESSDGLKFLSSDTLIKTAQLFQSE